MHEQDLPPPGLLCTRCTVLSGWRPGDRWRPGWRAQTCPLSPAPVSQNHQLCRTFAPWVCKRAWGSWGGRARLPACSLARPPQQDGSPGAAERWRRSSSRPSGRLQSLARLHQPGREPPAAPRQSRSRSAGYWPRRCARARLCSCNWLAVGLAPCCCLQALGGGAVAAGHSSASPQPVCPSSNHCLSFLVHCRVDQQQRLAAGL